MSQYKCQRTIGNNEGLQEMRSQWENGENCDAVLTVGTKSIPVQRAFLAAASPYFNSLFSSYFREGSQYMIDLSQTFDCAETLQDIISYFYGNIITINVQNIEKYLSYCSILDLQEVQETCFKYLLLNLDMSNCLWTWILADRYDLLELRHVCKDICSCWFHNFLAFQEDIFQDVPVEHMVYLLKQGLAKFCKKVQFQKFVETYTSFDKISRGNFTTVLMEAYEQGSRQKLDSEQGTEEAVLIQDELTYSTFIYIINIDQWYKFKKSFTENHFLPYGHIIRALAVGPESDHVLWSNYSCRPTDLKLMNMNTLKLQAIRTCETVEGRPICDRFYFVRNDPNRGNILLSMLFEMGDILSSEPLTSFHLYELNFNENKWEPLIEVTKNGNLDLLYPLLSQDHSKCFFLIKLEDPTFIVSVFSFSSREYTVLSTYSPEPAINNNEIYFNEECAYFTTEFPDTSKLSYRYHIPSNKWAAVPHIEDANYEAMKFQDFMAMFESENKKKFIVGCRNGLNIHFASWNPFTKEHGELCPVPVARLTPRNVIAFWQRIPASFFKYLSAVDRVDMDPSFKPLSPQYCDKLLKRYQKRTRIIQKTGKVEGHSNNYVSDYDEDIEGLDD